GGSSLGIRCFSESGTTMSRVATSPDARSICVATRVVSSLAETTRILDPAGGKLSNLPVTGLFCLISPVAGSRRRTRLPRQIHTPDFSMKVRGCGSSAETDDSAESGVVHRSLALARSCAVARAGLTRRIIPASRNPARQLESGPGIFGEYSSRGLEP